MSDQTPSRETRKPLHFFSVLAALAYSISAMQDWLVIEAREMLRGTHIQVDHRMVGYIVFQSLTVLTTSAVQFAGLALAIELIDKIRWSSLSREDRDTERSRYLLVKLRRAL